MSPIVAMHTAASALPLTVQDGLRRYAMHTVVLNGLLHRRHNDHLVVLLHRPLARCRSQVILQVG